MELHERIYQLRKEKNMTQQDLADQLRVSRQAVSRWEMGTAKPEIDSLTALAKIFGITVDELLTGVKAPATETPAVSEEKPRRNPRKWVIAWMITYAIAVAAAAVWLVVEWKFGTSFMAISPVTLIVQIINIGFSLGIVFLIAYFICKPRKK